MSISHQITSRRRAGPTLLLVVVLAASLSAHGGSVLAATGPGPSGAPPRANGALAGPGAVGSAATVAQAATTAAPIAAAPVAVAAPRVRAKAVLLADESTGQVLFERNASSARAMASTTKVMTALLALERLDERRVVRISPGPPQVGEESLRLRQGERLTVRQLLLGLLLKSANDASVALAEAVDGSEAAFVRRMNRKAAALRLGATHYVTPYGLDRAGHQTSARDLARLWEVAMRRADFRSIVAMRSARLPGGPLSLRRFVTTNQLLGTYRWTVGGKTGFTNRAGRCLVASASRGGRRLVAVALGSPNAFPDVHALFEYGFSKFVRVRLAQRGQPVSTGSGRPATLQAGADADALVRLDQLDQVRLFIPPGATARTGEGAATGSGTQGSGGSPAQGSGGSAAAGSGGSGFAWLMADGRRLVTLPLAPIPAGGAGPPSTPVPPTTGANGAAAGIGGPSGTTLTAGPPVRPWPVPSGAPSPAIDPTLRRGPP